MSRIKADYKTPQTKTEYKTPQIVKNAYLKKCILITTLAHLFAHAHWGLR